MVRRFNPPPGWPEAPAGWMPSKSWTPDPSWPPVPAGWVLVVDDDDSAGRSAPEIALSSSPSGSLTPGSGSGWAPVAVESGRVSASTISLLVVSSLATLSVVLILAGIPSLILAVAAIVNRSNLRRSRRLTNVGWIVFGVILGLSVAATILDYAYSPEA